MKKLGLGLVVVCMMVCVSSSAFAVPFLQLDVSNGVYDTTTQTVFSTGDDFDLYALINPNNSFFEPGETYYLSAALVTDDSQPVDQGGDYGAFIFNGVAVDVTGDMVYGTAPVDLLAQNLGLANHGIFPTYFTEFDFTIDPARMTTLYNSQDVPGGLDPTGTDLYYVDFDIDMSLLAEGYQIHFDLYTKNVDGTINAFAPFSHDAQSGGTPPDPVPEPATLLLMGVGLFGLRGLARKKKTQ